MEAVQWCADGRGAYYNCTREGTIRKATSCSFRDANRGQPPVQKQWAVSRRRDGAVRANGAVLPKVSQRAYPTVLLEGVVQPPFG